MDQHLSLVDACRSVGLDCRCEHRPGEPRFRLGLDHSRTRPLLYLTLRNDDSLRPRPIDADAGVPGVLFEVVEETVAHGPRPHTWHPCSRRHRFVVWRELEGWHLQPVRGAESPGAVAEAVATAPDRQRTRG